MRRFRFVSLFALFWVAAVCAAQQQATVTHNVNLRSDPSSHNSPISMLRHGEVLQLVVTDQTKGRSGWIVGKPYLGITRDTPAIVKQAQPSYQLSKTRFSDLL